MNILPSPTLKISLLALSLAALAPCAADEPGRGLTAPLERAYLELTIDHEFAGLRMTELAAGTDHRRDAQLNPGDGTSPTPDTEAVSTKARLPAVVSLARLNNRKQREMVLMAQDMLRRFYGAEHAPRIRATDASKIALLEQTPAGEEFDREFLKVLARHHYQGVAASTRCLVGAEPEHLQLKTFCRNLIENELNEIEMMRLHLCEDFSICDYQPLADPKGRHEEEPAAEQPDPPLTDVD